ncbi:hypothetical protein ACP70R_002925 [Stipagrostis hirtigluma subsp. patula]
MASNTVVEEMDWDVQCTMAKAVINCSDGQLEVFVPKLFVLMGSSTILVTA